MQLGELVEDIKDELNKNNLEDSTVKRFVRTAIRGLEIKNTWAYMDRFVDFDISTAAANPRVLPMPPNVRGIEFVRIIGEDGLYHYLDEVLPRNISSTTNDRPTRYWKDGMQYIWLDNTPQENYSGEMSYLQFAEWNSDDTYEPWLMQVAFPLVKYETITLMAPYLRELELMQAYGAIRQDALQSALIMNEELEYSNHTTHMQYK